MANSFDAHSLEIHHGFSIPGTFSNISIHRSPLGDSAIKELRAAPTDLRFINGTILVFENQLRPIWSVLSHENIVPLRGIYTNNGPLPIIEVPYYRNGNILDYNFGATSSTKLHQSSQIAAGLSYLHEKGFHHGNICPTNIMIKDDGGVCIADPAVNMLMRRLTYDPYVPTPATWRYKPWEELLNDTSGPEADVYSWASVVYEVFCGRQPYHHSRGIVKIINHGHRTLDKPPEISPELWSILQKCWMLNPAARPSMPEVELELHELE